METVYKYYEFRLFSLVLILMLLSGPFKMLHAQEYVLADPAATKKTKALFENMKMISRDGVMIGHQDALAYVLLWRNARPNHHYAPFSGHSSADDFIKFHRDPYTLFTGDLPKMYKLPK